MHVNIALNVVAMVSHFGKLLSQFSLQDDTGPNCKYGALTLKEDLTKNIIKH